MKVALVGLEGLVPGKKKLFDERVKALARWSRSAKTTFIAIECLPEEDILKADGILCAQERRLDLILQDLENVETRVAQAQEAEKGLFLSLKEALEQEVPAFESVTAPQDRARLSNYNLVTLRPILFYPADELPAEEELLRRIYAYAGRISFFTTGPKESRAWEIREGMRAQEAAGSIHSDIQRGFIRAEVMGFQEIAQAGSLQEAKSRGVMRLEGKEYVVKDGDVITFRFSV